MFPQDLGSALRESATAHADRWAIWAAGRRLTYRDLFDEAARIAAAILASGATAGDKVAILSRRTTTAYAGILGALLAGCTYVPLNTAYKPDRNGLILRSSGARTLVVDAFSAARLRNLADDVADDIAIIAPEPDAPAVEGVRAMFGDADMPSISLADLPKARPIDPEEIAYLMFTSATTGAPKGVPITHANVAAYLNGVKEIAPFTADERLLQFVELTFDLSVHDMFLTWLNGAELYSIPENANMLAPRMIVQHQITWCFLVPSTMARAIQQGLVKPGRMTSLKVSLFCGEALPQTVARAWQEAATNGEVFNVYGPTETTIAITWYRFDPTTALEFASVPIGRPFKGQALLIVDDANQPCTEGQYGHLLLGGTQLMKGYWQAPHLDADRFVTLQGARWYKTGDLARWVEPYGAIFAGRSDRQVKIRGYLVELQEVEGVLRRVSGHQDVAVIPWPKTMEGSYDGSVAFIAAPQGDEAQLRSACRAAVADYMTADRMIFVDELPRNANGKVDYNVLARHPALEPAQTPA